MEADESALHKKILNLISFHIKNSAVGYFSLDKLHLIEQKNQLPFPLQGQDMPDTSSKSGKSSPELVTSFAKGNIHLKPLPFINVTIFPLRDFF